MMMISTLHRVFPAAHESIAHTLISTLYILVLYHFTLYTVICTIFHITFGISCVRYCITYKRLYSGALYGTFGCHFTISSVFALFFSSIIIIIIICFTSIQCHSIHVWDWNWKDSLHFATFTTQRNKSSLFQRFAISFNFNEPVFDSGNEQST